MPTPAFSRRRAERFAQLLDEADGGRRHHARSTVDDELTGLVALGHRVRELRQPAAAEPEFRAGLRAMLMATAEREGIGVTAATGREAICDDLLRPASELSRWRRRWCLFTNRPARTRVAIAAGVLTGAIAISSISAASGNAVPGDALYGMKRSTERAQLALANSDLSRGQLFLGFARTRLGEAAAVRADAVGFAAALDDMDADTSQGVRLLTSQAVRRGDQAALDVIERFLATQRERMAGLTDEVDRTNRERAAASLALLDSIRIRTGLLRAALVCGTEPSVRSDSLGPLPRPCPSARPTPGVGPAPSTGSRRPVGRSGEERPGRSDRGNPASDLPTGGLGDQSGKLTRPADDKPDDNRPSGGRPSD